MQEHIRRAHPDHYIPKLPATEDSFRLMINTPPSKKTLAPRRGHCRSKPYISYADQQLMRATAISLAM